MEHRDADLTPRPQSAQEAFGAAIAALFRSQSRGHWVERLAPLDTCVAPVPTLEEVMESEHFRAREIFVECDHPGDGKIVRAAFTLKISGARLSVRPAPLQGEHSDEILCGAGFDGAAIAAMAAAGVIRSRRPGQRWRSELANPPRKAASQGGHNPLASN